ncbi:MAG: lipopolysaccharide heptosyltransferase I [Betaproteobacteria bacterium]|nr:lipopolysaccharide heptosyltransferase I [Betaproteobacteria bacterium]
MTHLPAEPRILLVKTSSMGDVIHNLPVASDILANFPGARIDWAVEESFADIPRLHPGVHDILPLAFRRWKKRLFSPTTWREIKATRAMFAAREYDFILDTQGLVKSAWITRWAKGKKIGFAADSAREPLAARFYNLRLSVPKNLHAITRNRRLAAAAFGYDLPEDGPDYGLTLPLQESSDSVVFLTASSLEAKLWPETRWINLGRALSLRDLIVLLPGGSPIERRRAEHIAGQIPGAQAIPPMRLADLASLLANARFAVGVDTGLSHLAAAAGVPTLVLHTITAPERTGVFCRQWHQNLGGKNQTPDVEVALTALAQFLPAAQS